MRERLHQVAERVKLRYAIWYGAGQQFQASNAEVTSIEWEVGQEWARAHIQFSNLNLIFDRIEERTFVMSTRTWECRDEALD